MRPRISFQGAAGEVTGSRHLLESGATRVLLDCGLFQGGRETEQRNQASFPFYASFVNAVVLSHAHLDHSGRLPQLVAEGFSGPIYCTPATRELLGILLKDAALLQERDVEWENRRRRRSGRPLLEPLYDLDDVHRTLDLCRPLEYCQYQQIGSDLRLRFLDAGHILGAAIAELEIEHPDGRIQLVYSGDLGNPETLLMHHPEVPARADWVIMESTYGDRDHQPLGDTKEELAGILQRAHERQGNVLIPAFAVGRTQEVLYHLALLGREGRLPQQKVYLDSPMAIEVTGVYLGYLRLLDTSDLGALTANGRYTVPEALDFLTPTPTAEESIALNRIKGGAVIIAGSGMCEGGRIRHHLKHNLWQRNAELVIVGYQAEGTLGRALVDGTTQVHLLGEDIQVNAGINTLGGYSAHAGRSQLLAWARSIEGRPRFCLVHGETGARDALSQALREQLGRPVTCPARNDVVELQP